MSRSARRHAAQQRRALSQETLMKKTLVLMVLSLLLGSTGAYAQGASDTLRAKVDALLGGIEYVPTQAEWKALGPDAGEVLAAIATDSAQRATVRARAMSALAYFPQPTSIEVARAALADAKSPVILQRKALLTLATIDPDALNVVEPYLAHDDVQLRESAVQAVSTLGNPLARQLLEARVSVEPSEHIRSTIATSLQSMAE
jgi:HEAT repeat protein